MKNICYCEKVILSPASSPLFCGVSDLALPHSWGVKGEMRATERK